MSRWGRVVERVARLVTRPVPVERESLLVETATRFAEVGRRGIHLRCESCDGKGPYSAMVLAWSLPIREGGKRERQNIRAVCAGCWDDTGRDDGLPVPHGAAIEQRDSPHEAQTVICLCRNRTCG